ncbi:hypothetical protein BJ165DRAFT_1397762 [Panaeolus papilionaceus]|nr:hypothetical protein BJ165DRAFT_1397762 [Panaeolus papilionaceus]
MFHRAWAAKTTVPGGVITQMDVLLVIRALFGSLEIALEQSGGGSMAKGDSSRWPRRIEDILPDSSDQVVENLIVWAYTVPYPIILGFGTTLLRICKIPVSSSLAKYRVKGRLCCTAQDALCIVTALEEGPTSGLDSTRRNSGYLSITTSAESFRRFVEELRHLRPMESQILVMDGFETRALQHCSLLCYLIP